MNSVMASCGWVWGRCSVVWGGSQLCYFFFQAEDGIRDLTVTGVQTCALPISLKPSATLLVPILKALSSPPKPPPCSRTSSAVSAIPKSRSLIARKIADEKNFGHSERDCLTGSLLASRRQGFLACQFRHQKLHHRARVFPAALQAVIGAL